MTSLLRNGRGFIRMTMPSARLLKSLLFVGALSATILFVACDGVEPPVGDDLDWRLHAALQEAGGAAAFVLPDNEDFAAIPQDPRNPLNSAKVELGRLLFHETALAVDPVRPEGLHTYSCATCHHADAGFESGLRQSMAEGGLGFASSGSARTPHPSYPVSKIDTQPIRTQSPLNGAWQEVAFWNGQFGSTGVNEGTEDRWRDGSPQAVNHLGYAGLEAQAIAALETHRMSGGAEIIAEAYPRYRHLFDAAFPEWPQARRASQETAGLAIAAFERTLVADKAPFQRWLRGETGALNDAEKRGALLFFGRAGCLQCHSGPSLGSATFHALGMGDLQPTLGRFDLADPLHFGRGAFTGRDEDNFRFKTPQLYNVADRPALGHGATFASVEQVVHYKNSAVAENRYVSAHRLSPLFRPLSLTESEVEHLTAFIEHGLRDPDLTRYVPPELPSGNCFPANDPQSRRDLGCGAAGKKSHH